MNLTALPLDPPTDETFDRLLIEPLAASRQVRADMASVWFDLGSGGGRPAIPLKIARQQLRLTMIESKERKSAFLREAARSHENLTSSQAIPQYLSPILPHDIDILVTGFFFFL